MRDAGCAGVTVVLQTPGMKLLKEGGRMALLGISKLNTGWGICGFASALGALHHNGQFKETIDNIKAADLKYRLLAEIKTYLVILQSENEHTLLDEIVSFTCAFGGKFSTFTIEEYIEKVNSIASKEPDVTDSKFGIAMPPNAVVDYLKRIGGLNSAKLFTANKDDGGPNNIILGLSRTGNDKLKRWNGLRHWVYKKSDTEIYNYGNIVKYTDLMSGPRKYKPAYHITLSK